MSRQLLFNDLRKLDENSDGSTIEIMIGDKPYYYNHSLLTELFNCDAVVNDGLSFEESEITFHELCNIINCRMVESDMNDKLYIFIDKWINVSSEKYPGIFGYFKKLLASYIRNEIIKSPLKLSIIMTKILCQSSLDTDGCRGEYGEMIKLAKYLTIHVKLIDGRRIHITISTTNGKYLSVHIYRLDKLTCIDDMKKVLTVCNKYIERIMKDNRDNKNCEQLSASELSSVLSPVLLSVIPDQLLNFWVDPKLTCEIDEETIYFLKSVGLWGLNVDNQTIVKIDDQ